MDLKLDWLSFTFKPDFEAMQRNRYQSIWDNAFDYINEDTCVIELRKFFLAFPELAASAHEFEILRGRSHYEFCIGIESKIFIHYNSLEYSSTDMGVNISIPSHGLEWFFGLFNLDCNANDSCSKLFVLLKERGCHCTRLDLAFDDYEKTFRPKWYCIQFNLDNIKTNFRKLRTASCMHDVGWTWYLGDRKKRMLRIYDKDVESRGEIDAVRYEFELHQHHAKHMFDYIIEFGAVDFIEYLQTFFTVIDRSTAKHKGHCKLLKEWEEWLLKLDFSEELEHEQPITGEVPKSKRTLTIIPKPAKHSYREAQKTLSWFLKSCCPNLSMAMQVYGIEEVISVIKELKSPLTPKWQILKDRYIKEQHEQDFSDIVLYNEYDIF